MLPALLKYSSAAAMVQRFPPEDRDLHSESNSFAASELAENRATEWRAEEEDEEDVDLGPGVFGTGAVDASMLDLLAL